MSLLSENIIPGNYGKIFGTNAESVEDLKKIKKRVLAVKGVKDVILNSEVFPLEFTVHTKEVVDVKDVEDAVIKSGFHAVAKDVFEL
jgi:hypothetical protein